MLNRIVVSGGTYRDWLETVYTGSNYFERCETPIFEGGTSQEIVFQEVVSNAASEEEPLGSLAGRGVTTNKQRGGHHFIAGCVVQNGDVHIFDTNDRGCPIEMNQGFKKRKDKLDWLS